MPDPAGFAGRLQFATTRRQSFANIMQLLPSVYRVNSLWRIRHFVARWQRMKVLLLGAGQVFTPIAQSAKGRHFIYMKILFLKQIWTTVGVLGLLAEEAVASPQAVTNGKTVDQTNAAVATPMAPPAAQPYAPIGGAFTPTLMEGAQWPGYLNGNNLAASGGQFGPAPAGGTFYAGPLGGAMNGQNPPGGRWTGVSVGGAISPGFPPGGMVSGQPAGGHFGTNILGGLRSPSNSFSTSTKGVIVGGAPTAGASPGGVIVAGAAPGGVMTGGASPGGIIVGGAPPNTNAPGGHLH